MLAFDSRIQLGPKNGGAASETTPPSSMKHLIGASSQESQVPETY